MSHGYRGGSGPHCDTQPECWWGCCCVICVPPRRAGKAPQAHILHSNAPAPWPSHSVSLLLSKRSSRLRPAETLSRNVSSGPCDGPFSVVLLTTNQGEEQGHLKAPPLRPCRSEKAFIEIKTKTPQWFCAERHRGCFQSGSAAARKQTVLSHPHL